MHFKWNYEEPTPEQQKSAKELADKLSMSPILAQLLIHRGITTESAAKRFFRPQLSDLINPFLMKDMDIAALTMQWDARSVFSYTEITM